MKKFLFFAAALSALSLFSCKEKNRVCKCTYPDGSVDAYTIIDKTSKKQALFACEGSDNIKYTTDNEHYITDSKNCKLQ